MKIEQIINKEPYNTFKIYVETESPKIYTLNDWHIGSDTCNYNAIRAYIDYISKQEDAIVIGLGDLVEAATRYSVGAGVYHQDAMLNDQIKTVVELLKPIKDKIAFMTGGNHEDRAEKDVGVDVTDMISTMLAIPYYEYSEIMFTLVRKSGTHTKAVSVYANHTRIGGKNPMLIMNNIENNVAKNMIFDIYIKAHDHHAGVSPPIPYYIFNKRTATLDKHYRYHVLTGSFLQRANSYATKKPYPPNLIGSVELSVDMRFDSVFNLKHNILHF